MGAGHGTRVLVLEDQVPYHAPLPQPSSLSLLTIFISYLKKKKKSTLPTLNVPIGSDQTELYKSREHVQIPQLLL